MQIKHMYFDISLTNTRKRCIYSQHYATFLLSRYIDQHWVSSVEFRKYCTKFMISITQFQQLSSQSLCLLLKALTLKNDRNFND